MNILFISRQFSPVIGGTETYIKNLAAGLVRKNHEVSILTLNRDIQDRTPLHSFERIDGIHVYRIPFFGFSQKPFGIYNPFVMIKKFYHSDIIHLHDLRFFFFTTIFLNIFFRKKIFLSSHGFIHHQKKLQLFKKNVFKFYYKPLFHFFTGIHVVSQGDYNLIQGQKKSIQIRKIPGGVEDIFLNKAQKKDLKLRPINLAYFGRLDSHKNIALLIDFTIKNPQYRLHIIYGSSSAQYMKELKTQIELHHASHLFYWHEKLPNHQVCKLLQTIDFCLFPSLYEGFGLSLIEAMGSSCLVIANNNQAYSEIIKNKHDGFLITMNYKNLKEKLDYCQQLTAAQVYQVKENAYNKAKTFQWDKIVDKMILFYTRPKDIVHEK